MWLYMGNVRAGAHLRALHFHAANMLLNPE
jgi:hypothetical protein